MLLTSDPKTELLDSFSQKELTKSCQAADTEVIGFCKSTFAWSTNDNGSSTPSRRQFLLRIDEELVFKRGCFNIILGSTGSGKTSLLMALLGEYTLYGNGQSSVVRSRRDAFYPILSGFLVQSSSRVWSGLCCTGILGSKRHNKGHSAFPLRLVMHLTQPDCYSQTLSSEPRSTKGATRKFCISVALSATLHCLRLGTSLKLVKKASVLLINNLQILD